MEMGSERERERETGCLPNRHECDNGMLRFECLLNFGWERVEFQLLSVFSYE